MLEAPDFFRVDRRMMVVGITDLKRDLTARPLSAT